MKNLIIFSTITILTVAICFFEQSNLQMALLLILFLSTGLLMKRFFLFAGIAATVIFFVFTVKNNFDINSSDPKIRKFNFSIGDREE